MERAAYRMIVTDDTLLDIATAAGFSSHEAFTRALPARLRVGAVNLA